MKNIKELYDCDYDVMIKGIKINSKEIEENDLFLCTMGVKVDRHDYIDEAIEKGASVIVVSKDIPPKNVPVIKVENTNNELVRLMQTFCDHPEKELEMIGITGTDGKTSTASIVYSLLDNSSYIGTNGRCCKNFQKDTNNTTPDADKLYPYIREFVDNGCTSLVMEASSEAFFRNRLTNLEYSIGAITNITSEHLNIHGTFENYKDCKLQLFRQIKKDGYAILNKDDPFYEETLDVCKCNVLTYGKDDTSDLVIVNYKVMPDRTLITYKYKDKTYDIESPLLGEFNVYNLACALLICVASSKSIDEVIPLIKDINISGRLDMLPNIGQNFYVMVDYAHTPNGIESLLKFVHTLDINRSIVVIGQAGERDYIKRPIVGKTVCDNASYAIFCYEDPRSENPKDIIDMMISDIRDYDNYEIVIDRSQAIKKAIDMAKEKDIVLILGKGNETYEKLKDKVIYFNDIEEAMKHLKNRVAKEQIKI